MTRRLESTITSELFMNDPVPVRNYENPKRDESTYFTKGYDDNETSGESFEHVGGEDDAFIIHKEGGPFRLSRKELRDTLEDLKTQSHVHVKHLNERHTAQFKTVVEAMRMLYGSQALYDIVLTDIKHVFNNHHVKPGTVAAHFVGCFNDSNFPGPLGCSPKCASSLKPTDGTPGYSNCDDLVLIYCDGMFSALNEKRSSHAYIYISDSNFNGFTSDNIKQLCDAGIETVSLIFGNPDGSYREITGALSLDQLPRTNHVVAPCNTNTETSNNAGVIFAIIILAIIILLLIIIYRNYGLNWLFMN